MLKYINKQNIATLFLVLMCIQYLPLEGYTISYIKFTAMCLTPIIWLAATPKISKAFVWAGLYFVAILFSGLFNLDSFRFSTVGYLLSFIFMFIMYYNLVWVEEAFSADYFIRLLKRLILAYTICLIMQQAVRLVGINSFPLINLLSGDSRGIMIGNSLMAEQSHSARILTVLFLSLLRMYEVKWGKENVNIKAIYADAKWVLLGFLWSMLTMGSGTAFAGLGILSLYFIKRQYALTAVPLLLILYFAIPYIEFEPLQRAKVTLEATLTMDASAVKKADGSAAARVVPLLNTINHIDLLDADTWLGEGVDKTLSEKYLSDEQMLGTIKDYGLLSYILLLIFIFTCCIRFKSLETLIFVILMSANLANVAYGWGIMMLFATTRYFKKIQA